METPQKRLKIVIGINSLTNTLYEAYTNHCQFWFRLGRSYPEIDFIICNPARMSIDRMRNTAARVALESEADYLLFVDDDVLVPMDGLAKLLRCDADIAAGKVVIRGYPFSWMLFKPKSTDMDGLYACEELPEEGIEPVGAVGFSFCLIKTEVLRNMIEPFFVTGISNTEDIYFCIKAKQINPDIKIVCECSCNCGHILWPEVMNASNRLAYKRYFEEMNPSVLKAAENQDRGADYLLEVESALGATNE